MKYFVINKSRCKTEVCNGKDELISFCAAYNYVVGGKKRNSLLENIAMNNNDKKLKSDFVTSQRILVPREFMVYDGLNRIIDPRFFYDDILNYKANSLTDNSNQYEEGMPRSNNSRVKAIARCGNKFRHYFRQAKITNEKRYNAIPEYKAFVRGKRKVSHISPVFDDYYVHTEKSWKRLKIKKQYMKKYIKKNFVKN